ncbi:MAG: sialidase family protein [Gammaproteobacteria bacterium]
MKIATQTARSVALSCIALLVAVPGVAGQRVSEPGRRAISPEIAVGPDGAVNVIWLDKGLTADRPAPKPRKPGEHSHRSATDLYFARSGDSGRSWSVPSRVNPDPGGVWGFAVSKPRIAVGPTGTIHVFYPANDESTATGLDVVSARYTRSTDNGGSFEAPIALNRPATLDRSDILGEGLAMTNSFGTMGVAPDGTVFTAWQDVAQMEDTSDGADAVVAVSRNDGASFEAERTVLPGNDVCPCCQLTVAFGDDAAYMGYRKIYADGRDSTVARSTDGGRSFVDAGRLDLARWDIDGCPLKPTELAVDGELIYAAAFTGGEDPAGLYFSRSRDGGAHFAGARQVHPAAPYSDAPALSVDGTGIVRLVWHAKVGGPRRLFTSVSLDSGETLSGPAELPTPAGTSAYPATAVGADGTVYVAWQQENEEVFVMSLPAPGNRMADE